MCNRTCVVGSAVTKVEDFEELNEKGPNHWLGVCDSVLASLGPQIHPIDTLLPRTVAQQHAHTAACILSTTMHTMHTQHHYAHLAVAQHHAHTVARQHAHTQSHSSTMHTQQHHAHPAAPCTPSSTMHKDPYLH